MVLKLLTIFALLGGFSYCADHDTFKDCARVEFCSRLRNLSDFPAYTVFTTDLDDGVQLVLSTFDGSATPLIVNITFASNNLFRVKIADVDSKRYQLQDVLVHEPEEPSSHSISVDDVGTIHISSDETDTELIITSDPEFKIEFLTNGVVQFVFGEKIIMDNDEERQSFAFSGSFPLAHQLYGIHEHAENLALQNTGPGGLDPYRLRNLDVFGYELNSPMALYGSVPVLYGHGPNGTAGIFLHNAAEQWYDINNSETGSDFFVMAESGVLDLIVLGGPSIADVVQQYTNLTGTAHMPQLWTLGYHQSRYSYDTQEDVTTVVANFDNFDFPMDCIWLDIDYTDGKKYFTWNPENFSDPIGMQQNISATNRKLVTIIDPHIKVDLDYEVYRRALEQYLFVLNSDNETDFQGNCWPGLSSYLDFLDPAARSYFASWYSYEKFVDSTPTLAGIWNDMNEPSVFDIPEDENTIPGDALHHGNVAHRDIHNIYGMLNTMSTHQGLMERDNGEVRPFILSRSHFAGSQRFAAIWTGDNTADWGYLAISYPECLNANLLGLVFCGADVGGFNGNPDEELLQRWYQAGAWLPFYRAHSEKATDRREPYLFSEDVQVVLRDAMQQRYKHLPIWYTLFYEHTRYGSPVVRPLFYHYPEDTNVFSIDNQLLLGENILVRAVTEPGVATVQVYFPGGPGELWILESTNEVYDGTGFVDVPVDLGSIPVFYRGGSVTVRKDTVRPSTADMVADGHTLYVIFDAHLHARSTIYIDDNTSFKYQDNLEYNYLSIDITYDDVTITPIDADAQSDAFPFVIDAIVYIEIEKLPENGKPGSYRKIVHDKDAAGTLLKDLKFDFKLNTSVTIKMK